ncbi:hypothetical protein P691DRAFT_797434 [Macrolepiota fuliginosa MF-IS2]|uniref:Nephrocystin 3-like N-terminal domain-containing protein n=1 Tax=Macrolepiota fuliginosa MF-IS2 TaxID=1400762 RepID=A0A9P6C755_9AGAR|nr:hypothetical protein P691DRAFT_797434 [Macrolepiota fuliginosa MF-IS2]
MEKGMPSAMHDSSFRTYPPRCHPGTRETLRKHIVGWGEGDGCDGRMFWVLGPPAVGKSAIAQTVAEEFEERRSCLGASFFFSRSNQLDDPDRVIPTLAAQLATKHPQYKYILTQRLADNPLILEKNRRTQFRELIIEPFHTIMIHHPSQPPLLIILDGLDECKDKQAQCEFIELISTHVRQVNKFPLRWLICSRPEWYLKSMLSDVDFHVICKRQELEIENRQAEEDVRRLLVAGFDKIRKRYKDRLPIDWPPEVCLQRIASVASGHFDSLATSRTTIRQAGSTLACHFSVVMVPPV